MLYTDAETLLNEGGKFNYLWYEVNVGERVFSSEEGGYVFDRTVAIDLLEGVEDKDKGALANKPVTINLTEYSGLSYITYFYYAYKDGSGQSSIGYIEVDMNAAVNVIPTA